MLMENLALTRNNKKFNKNILIFHKTNGWLNLSEEENKEVFDLTVGGLGLTGSIINITFKLSEITSKKFVTKNMLQI